MLQFFGKKANFAIQAVSHPFFSVLQKNTMTKQPRAQTLFSSADRQIEFG
jgi:hypothetical protein